MSAADRFRACSRLVECHAFSSFDLREIRFLLPPSQSLIVLVGSFRNEILPLLFVCRCSDDAEERPFPPIRPARASLFTVFQSALPQRLFFRFRFLPCFFIRCEFNLLTPDSFSPVCNPSSCPPRVIWLLLPLAVPSPPPSVPQRPKFLNIDDPGVFPSLSDSCDLCFC